MGAAQRYPELDGPCPSCLSPAHPIRPELAPVNQSVFQGLHALRPDWGNHLDGDGAWQKDPLSSYKVASSVYQPSPAPMGQTDGMPCHIRTRDQCLGRLAIYRVVLQVVKMPNQKKKKKKKERGDGSREKERG